MSYILIVDAVEELRRSLSLLLQREGHTVREESDSGSAIARVMEKPPLVIVVDENMDPLEGVELLPLIRRLSRAPIIVIGSGGEEAVVKALLEGADMYVTRPINFTEMLSRINALSRRQGGENAADQASRCAHDGQQAADTLRGAARSAPLNVPSLSRQAWSRSPVRTRLAGQGWVHLPRLHPSGIEGRVARSMTATRSIMALGIALQSRFLAGPTNIFGGRLAFLSLFQPSLNLKAQNA